MYAMPLSVNEDGSYRVFWEETSLVGRGERRLTFEECKRRALRRLEYHGISISDVEEEEYCYIPMGGELPDLTQRIVAFGGAANMVHPSTGYHACRMLAASSDVSRVIGEGVRGQFSPDKIAAEAYKSIWSNRNRGQRDFQAIKLLYSPIVAAYKITFLGVRWRLFNGSTGQGTARILLCFLFCRYAYLGRLPCRFHYDCHSQRRLKIYCCVRLAGITG